MGRILRKINAIACLAAIACIVSCDPPVGGDEEGANTPAPTATPAPAATASPGATVGPTGITGTYIDDGFGADNYTQTRIGTGSSTCRDIVVQSDGKIILAGNSYVSGQSDDFALVRYAADGYLDASFGSSGIVTADFYGYGDTGMAVGLQTIGQNAGKILAGGKVYRKEGSLNLDYFGVARFNADGTLDASFGTDGKVYFSVGTTLCLDICADMAILPDDSILLCGYSLEGSADTGYDVSLAKLEPNGALDASFGSGGIVVADLGLKKHELASRMAVDADGRIAVCGGSKNTNSNATCEFVMVFTPSGALDTSFNGTGSRTVNPGFADVGVGIDFQPDGKILLVGTTDANDMNEIILHRFTASGALDASFGGSGAVMVGASGTTNSGRAVLSLPGGKVLAVGDTYSESEMNFTFLASRYESNGAIDSTFASGGTAKWTFYSTEVNAKSAAIAADGAYIVAGIKDIGTPGYGFCMARYAQ